VWERTTSANAVVFIVIDDLVRRPTCERAAVPFGGSESEQDAIVNTVDPRFTAFDYPARLNGPQRPSAVELDRRNPDSLG
jgi:hypothetical protein